MPGPPLHSLVKYDAQRERGGWAPPTPPRVSDVAAGAVHARRPLAEATGCTRPAPSFEGGGRSQVAFGRAPRLPSAAGDLDMLRSSAQRFIGTAVDDRSGLSSDPEPEPGADEWTEPFRRKPNELRRERLELRGWIRICFRCLRRFRRQR